MGQARYSDASDPKEKAITAWFVACIGFVGAGALMWLLRWPLVLDMNDPQFNPMVFILALALGVGVWHTGLALRWQQRLRRFGATEMQIEGQVPAPLGKPLVGRLVFGQAIHAKGDFRVTLICYDVHETPDLNTSSTSSRRNESFPVWSQEQLVPVQADGLSVPFRFDLPNSVGLKPASPIRRHGKPYAEFKLFITIPGFRKAITPGSAPVGRYWTLKVAAKTDGPDFQADFTVPMQE